MFMGLGHFDTKIPGFQARLGTGQQVFAPSLKRILLLARPWSGPCKSEDFGWRRSIRSWRIVPRPERRGLSRNGSRVGGSKAQIVHRSVQLKSRRHLQCLEDRELRGFEKAVDSEALTK